MRREICLALNFALICLITFLLIRDRSINEMFEISIGRQDQSSIIIPGYQAACQQAGTLRCHVDLANIPLLIESSSNSNCKATYGKQITTCYRVQASALDTLYIQNLQLSQHQQESIDTQVRVRAIASLRILKDGVHNGVFLQAMLAVLSIVSGINAAKALYSDCRKSYPRNRLLQGLALLLGGLAVPLLLLKYFFLLLMFFGYVG